VKNRGDYPGLQKKSSSQRDWGVGSGLAGRGGDKKRQSFVLINILGRKAADPQEKGRGAVFLSHIHRTPLWKGNDIDPKRGNDYSEGPLHTGFFQKRGGIFVLLLLEGRKTNPEVSGEKGRRRKKNKLKGGRKIYR